VMGSKEPVSRFSHLQLQQRTAAAAAAVMRMRVRTCCKWA
jgi:hypothetical protein